ncbi:MAG TPA: hypothetical protein VM658_16055 [bacterium]|nr:hypothetical protein [bacterium]
MGNKIADVIFGTVGWLLLHLSDRRLARICRLLGRLAYAFTGNEFLKGVFNEIIDVFESGPPGTEIIRKIVREAHRPYVADMIQGFMGL